VKLRGRVALTLALLVLPFAVGLAVLQTWLRRDAVEEGIAETVRTRMQQAERQACEANPRTWPRRGFRSRPGARHPRRAARGRRPRRPGIFAYDAQLQSRNPRAPQLRPELQQQLRSGADVASLWGHGLGLVAVRMPWDEGPCAVVLVRRPAGGTGLRALLRSLWPSIAVSLVAVLIAVLTVGPTVRRVRRLTEQVRRVGREVQGGPAGQQYALDVAGRDEIAELARAFEASRDEVQKRMEQLRTRDATLTRYVANTTHDVMIPLTVLQGHLTALRQQVVAGEPVEQGVVDRALEESHYLTSLLHNLSAGAKLEAGEREMAWHAVDLGALVERVAARHEPIARHKGVELNHAVPESPTCLRGEPTLLEQAVSNLVHNAVRHNDAGGHVAVVLEREGDDAVLRVLDDGPGLSEARLAELERGHFTDAQARDRPRGLGLGLRIARDVASRHGLQLSFARSESGGLAVELRGPVATP
jgi:signal transduction histidine kinase